MTTTDKIQELIDRKYFWVRSPRGEYLEAVYGGIPQADGGITFEVTKTCWQGRQPWDAPEVEGEAPYWAGWFTEEMLSDCKLRGILPEDFGKAQLAPVSERARKEEAYSTISDLSKDLYGCRSRFDWTTWTLRGLLEEVEYLREANNRDLAESLD